MKRLISLTILLAAMSASAITATKAYVDKRDAATYAAATNAQKTADAAMNAASAIPFLRNRDDLSVGPRDVYWIVSYNGGEDIYLAPTDFAFTNFVGTSEDGSVSASVAISRLTTDYRYDVNYKSPPPLPPVAFSRISAKPLTQLSGRGLVATEQWSGSYYVTNTLALASDVAAVSNLVGSAAANATEALNLASAVSNNLPTKVSQLTNDVGYITLADVPPGGGGGGGVTEATYTNLATIVTNLASRPFIAGLNAQGYPVVAIDDQYTNLAAVIQFLKGE